MGRKSSAVPLLNASKPRMLRVAMAIASKRVQEGCLHQWYLVVEGHPIQCPLSLNFPVPRNVDRVTRLCPPLLHLSSIPSYSQHVLSLWLSVRSLSSKMSQLRSPELALPASKSGICQLSALRADIQAQIFREPDTALPATTRRMPVFNFQESGSLMKTADKIDQKCNPLHTDEY